ncbi:MAG: heme ABC exporter ATP-binding protein CcmA [Alphaproteobacteria bacterium]|nr:heme ABC exporter ATP-binding protein CcmA [Alphaproteobacteria bacterium]
MNGGARLEVSDLACRRGGRTVFEGLSFGLGAGQALLVTGPNGAGKSSLLRLLAGLLTPAAGEIANPFATAWLGHDNALKAERRLIDELRFWAAVDGTPAARIDAALDRFDLDAIAALPVRVLSSGQKRRAALARTWASGARLWLLDEPSVGLDVANVARLSDAMREHRAAGGLVIATSHVDIGLDDAAELAL